jgi:hypothetical protein
VAIFLSEEAGDGEANVPLLHKPGTDLGALPNGIAAQQAFQDKIDMLAGLALFFQEFPGGKHFSLHGLL